MSRLTRWMDRTLYPEQGDHWDTTRFRNLVLTHLAPEHTVLDYGAGRGGRHELDFRGRAARVVGVDVDPAVLANPALHEARLLEPPGFTIPYADATFDVAVSANVFEHLEQPAAALQEIGRVLKPGGICLVKTPNLHHYVATVARLTPHTFHTVYNRLRGREDRDTFPTVYRANTRAALGRAAEAAGLTVHEIACWEGRPEYLRLAAPLYVGGFLYERLVNRFARLASFRAVLVAVLVKPQ